MTILVTGAAGFIGANFVLDWLEQCNEPVVNLDLLTYAGNLENLKELEGDPRYQFVFGNIGDRELVSKLLTDTKPRAVINFAAESHVDRSIHGPGDFIQTTSSASSTCLNLFVVTGMSCQKPRRPPSASCMYPPMKFMVLWLKKPPPSRKQTNTNRIAPTVPARPPAITSFVPGTTPMGYPCSQRIAPTTTGHTTSRKSSFRSAFSMH